MLIVRTPLRVSLFGGGTDYPDFIESHGHGHVIGGAINKYVYLMSLPIVKGIHNFKLGFHFSSIEKVSNIDEIKFTPIRLAIQKHKLKDQFEYHLAADLPAMSGLGSSSAFAVSVMKTISEQHDFNWNDHQVYLNAIEFERTTLNETVGYQDQFFAANGNFLDVTWNRNGEVSKEKFDMEKVKNISENSLLINTRISRKASTVANEQIQLLSKNTHILKRILEISYEGKQAINEKNNTKIGSKINETWNLKKSLSPTVSNDKIDSMINKCLELGAYGVKLLGAGAGGFIYCLGDIKSLKLIKQEFKNYGTTEFEFVNKGTEKFTI